MMSEPGEFKPELLTRLHIGCALWADDDSTVADFHREVWVSQRGKSFFMTEGGWMRTAEGTAKAGDVLALVAGLELPLILSPVGDYCQIAAYAHVHGLMDGERWPKTLDEFKLVSPV